jgi:hypothetical protein
VEPHGRHLSGIRGGTAADRSGTSSIQRTTRLLAWFKAPATEVSAPMSAKEWSRKAARQRIEAGLVPHATRLGAGIRKGLAVFADVAATTPPFDVALTPAGQS